MHVECSFRASLIFRDIPDEFLKIAQVAYPWNSTVDTPKITGVPPHVLLMAELEELKIKFDALQNSIKSDMKDALDERGVGGSEFHTNSILEAIKVSETKMLSSYSKEIPSLVSEESGTLVITDENNALDNVNEGISENDLSNGGTIQDECEALVNRRTRTIQEALLSSRRLKMGYHNGRLQVLPPKWTFPKMNVKQLVDNWYVGSKKHCVPPLKLLEPLHVQHLGTSKNKNQGRAKLRQMKLIMSKIEEYATIEGVYDGNPAKWTSEYCTKLWENVGSKYINSIYRGNRTVEMSWKTLYNKMQKAKVFENNDDNV